MTLCALRYNAEHGMLDVYAADGQLLGAVPDEAIGRAYAETAIATYASDAGDPLTRLRNARRAIVLAGGTPNIPRVTRRDGEPWPVSVRRHQSALAIARRQDPPLGARAVGA